MGIREFFIPMKMYLGVANNSKVANKTDRTNGNVRADCNFYIESQDIFV